MVYLPEASSTLNHSVKIPEELKPIPVSELPEGWRFAGKYGVVGHERVVYEKLTPDGKYRYSVHILPPRGEEFSFPKKYYDIEGYLPYYSSAQFKKEATSSSQANSIALQFMRDVNAKRDQTNSTNPEATVAHERKNFLVLRTGGFISEIDEEEQAAIMGITLQRITPKMNFLVFDPNAESVRIEDQGRTQIIPYKTIPKKVYAKLDDYGSPEVLSKSAGIPVTTQYAVTIMLAEEY